VLDSEQWILNTEHFMRFLLNLVLGIWCFGNAFAATDAMTLSWANNLLTVSNANLPGGKLEIWYPEAFCRKGSRDRDWGETVLRQKTVLDDAAPWFLSFITTIEPNVVVHHLLVANVVTNELVSMLIAISNHGKESVDLEWFQPACIRVDKFTGCTQSNYTAKSFIFTERGLTTLDKTARGAEDAARYHGGQVYVPKGINLTDVNPRPICRDQPVNGLIGCFSADGKYLLATASDSTHELFEGVYVCLHSDPHVGGLAPGETKRMRSRIYFMTNDPPALLKRYQADFPHSSTTKSSAAF
jgi:hypothetical protein